MMVWDQDGLIDTPKTSHEFLEKVLNVLLTKLEWFGIMQNWFERKNAPRQTQER
jgi:hypothetical protein